MPAPPTKIILIRHGEKPAKEPSDTAPFDVLETGQPGGGRSLTVRGWQRAGALTQFFANPNNPAIATPDAIYAVSPKGKSQRSFETVTPLAAWLKYEQNTPQFNTNFPVDGGEAPMVQSALSMSGTVLICWEHHNIMPNIVGAIHHGVPIANFGEIPPKWHNVFYLVWVLDLQGNEYIWSQHNQSLLAGDLARES